MPPTLPPHLLAPGPGRVLLLPGPWSAEWRRWSVQLAKSGDLQDLRCEELWAVARRRGEALGVFLLTGLGAALRSRLHAGLAVLVLALVVLGTVLLALGLAR